MFSKEQNTLNISSTFESYIIGNEVLLNDPNFNCFFNFFPNQNGIENFEECVQDNILLPEKSLLNKQIDEPSKNKSSNLKEKRENKDKANDIITAKPKKNKGKKKQKEVKFLIRKTNYKRSGNITKKNSHRSSNFKNRILRNSKSKYLNITYIKETNTYEGCTFTKNNYSSYPHGILNCDFHNLAEY